MNRLLDGSLVRMERWRRRIFGELRKINREAAAEARPETWSESEVAGFRSRAYSSYNEYIRHQVQKLDEKPGTAKRFDSALRSALPARLLDLDLSGKRVLCLGARLGAEVAVFRDRGAFAVGIDLNPGQENRYTHYGDFHSLDYPDSCTDIVYTNSLDHVLLPDLFVGEVTRVLSPGGQLLLDVVDFEEVRPGRFESLSWESTEKVVSFIERAGFDYLSAAPFEDPWPGVHFRFAR